MMFNVFNLIREQILELAIELTKELNLETSTKIFDNFTVEPIKETKHGDISCNIAMIIAKSFTNTNLNNPFLVANALAEKLNLAQIRINQQIKFDQPIFKKIEIAKAGFINIFLTENFIHFALFEIVNSSKIIYPNLGKNIKVNLEYASPNPTGPMHVGHTRGAIYGDVLANLLSKCGYDVLKEYYINDAGVQINNLLKSTFIRYQQLFGIKVEISEGLYPGEYLIDIAKKLKNKFDQQLLTLSEDQYFPIIRNIVVDEMMEIIKADLTSLGIKHDNYFSEKKELHDSNKIKDAIDILKQKDLIYQGVLDLPKTAKGVGEHDQDYDQNPQTLFRSTLFGDDQDRVVIKSDGTYTYLASDIAYVLSKFQRNAKIFIMPLGYDHAGYVKRLEAVVEVLTNKQAQLKIILCQMVKFLKDGQPLKMSKRAGNFITSQQVLDEIGVDALRFLMLCRKNDTPFDFDLNLVIEQSKDNPIFYVQYAHARCCSILKNAHEIYQDQFFYDNKNLKKDLENNIEFLQLLTDQSELEIIKKLISYQRIIEMSAKHFEPHRIAFYLQELSAEFHALWNKGSDNPNLKFVIKDNPKLTYARLYLVESVKKIIADGLMIFSIKPIEEMK